MLIAFLPLRSDKEDMVFWPRIKDYHFRLRGELKCDFKLRNVA